MLDTVVVIAIAWLLLTAVGVILLAPLDRPRREALLPAAPVFGVVLSVVTLHDTTTVLSVRTGLWVILAVLVATVAFATHRDPSWLRPGRRALALLAAAAGCGLLPAIWVLAPAAAVGDSAPIQPNDSNDAFYYVSVAGWLQDHPATSPPQIAVGPESPGVTPAYAPARAQLDLDLRIGQELVHAAVSTVLDVDVRSTWYPLTALWVLLLPTAGLAAARCLRLGAPTGLLLGTCTSVSALVVFQVASQNSDSLLGITLAFLAVPAVLAALRERSIVPSWLAGLALAALVGTYTEFVPLVAPALAVAVLFRRPRELPAVARRALVVVGVAVVAAPLIWIRAISSLLFLGAIGSDTFPSAFADSPRLVVLARFLGAAGPSGGLDGLRTAAVTMSTATVAIGLIAAVRLTRRRAALATLVVVGLLLATYFGTVRHRPYTQQRVVELLLPLVLLVSAIGWDRLWRVTAVAPRRAAITRTRGSHTQRRVRRSTTGGRRRVRRRTRRARATTAAVLLGASVFVVSNGVTDSGLDLVDQARTRHVGPEFAEAAAWVREVGGIDGSGVSVLVGDFFSQLWITDALRDERDVLYPMLYPDYQYQRSYTGGREPRWLLTDADSVMRSDPGVVVRRNDRFRLLDLSRGRAAVGVMADAAGQNSWVFARSPQTPAVLRLVGSTRMRLTDEPVLQPGFGIALAPGSLDDGQTRLRVSTSTGGTTRVVLGDGQRVFVVDDIRFTGRDTG